MSKNDNNPASNKQGTPPLQAEDDLWDLDIDTEVTAPVKNTPPTPKPKEKEVKPAVNEFKETAPKTAKPKGNELTTEETETYSGKRSLSIIEIFSLLVFFAVLLSAAIYSYSWLVKQNKLMVYEQPYELPAAGKYATIKEFSTYWKSRDDLERIKSGVAFLPIANIILSDKSATGALRVRFYNEESKLIGDNITLPFKNGKFSNGKSEIEVVASDGFKTDYEFTAYQLEPQKPWEIVVLEAENEQIRGQDYKEVMRSWVSRIQK